MKTRQRQGRKENEEFWNVSHWDARALTQMVVKSLLIHMFYLYMEKI